MAGFSLTSSLLILGKFSILIDNAIETSSFLYPNPGHLGSNWNLVRRGNNHKVSLLFAVGSQSPSDGFSNDPSVLSLLDGEQETVTANRAYVEEEILCNSSAPRDELCMASEKERLDAIKWIKKCIKAESRSSTSAGGFGSASSNKKSIKSNKKIPLSIKEKNSPAKFTPVKDPDGYGAILQKDGVVRINQVLSKTTAESLIQHIDKEKDKYEKQVADGEVPELSRFSRVLLKNNRWDVLLPFHADQENENDGIIMQALYELLVQSKSVGNVIEATLGKDAELYEFACLISDPGSDRQVFHPDIAFQGESQIRTGPLLTCFVALQDINSQMGPTEFLPATNTQHFHTQLNDFSLRDDMLTTVPSKLSLLKEGDCTIHDATNLHAGSANRSDRRRRLFYFTFRSQSMEDPRTWNNPGSIRPELKEKHLSYKDIQKHLKSWKKKCQQ